MANVENYHFSTIYDKAFLKDISGISDFMLKNGDWLGYKTSDEFPKEMDLLRTIDPKNKEEKYFIINTYRKNDELDLGVLNTPFNTAESAIEFALKNDTWHLLALQNKE